MYRLQRASQLDLARIVHVEGTPCYIQRGGLRVQGEEEVVSEGIRVGGFSLHLQIYTMGSGAGREGL